MGPREDTAALAEAVREAAARGEPLVLRGAGTRLEGLPPHPGRLSPHRILELAGLRGVVDHDPRELVATVRAGTPLEELEAVLAREGQALPCEPARPGPGATLGGALAAADDGPARPWRGSLQDAVLGLELVDGRGERLAFGGRVLKNVAGYDLSRLMAGAHGTLGIVTRVHLKVLPRPEADLTRVLELPLEEALARMRRWQGRPLPLAGLAWTEGRLWVRLLGLEEGVAAAAAELGGADPGGAEAAVFWAGLRDRRLPFFRERAGGRLWRLALPPAAPQPPWPGRWLVDWGGARRWYRGPAGEAEIRAAARALGGWARPGEGPRAPFDGLNPAALAVLRRLKRALDPQGVLNPHLLAPAEA